MRSRAAGAAVMRRAGIKNNGVSILCEADGFSIQVDSEPAFLWSDPKSADGTYRACPIRGGPFLKKGQE